MLRRFLVRDRMVMTGLIVLGLLTVAAGFVSGRSTFQYALSTDARHAAMAWVDRAEREVYLLHKLEDKTIAGKPAKVIAPDLLANLRKLPPAYTNSDSRIAQSGHEVSGLLAGIDRMFSGWIRGLTELLNSDNYVSQVLNFALLEPNGQPVLRSADLAPSTLGAILVEGRFRSEFHKALGLQHTRVVDEFRFPGAANDEFRRMVLVPVIEGAAITRVYALEIDQSSAATMSKVALIAASMMTSLLIVLGYSVPAAVAFRRIRERWHAEDQIRFLAMHDPLTGLPNRVQLQNRLDQAVARAKRHDNLLAVMCLDLDRFKDVNDTLGHQTGDELLRQVADRLRDCVRETDVVARLGGDEFAVLAEDIDDPNGAIPVARRICDSLSRTFEIDGHNISTSGSVGISFAPIEGSDPDTLMNNADLALYRAKNDGKNGFRFFEPEMDRAVQDRRRMSNDLRRALRDDELSVHYQPCFDLRTGRLTGYEALARWNHPEKGHIPPDVFIPIAEEMGLIGVLGEWVLRTASRYACEWPDDTMLSVNVSPAQFTAQDIIGTIRNVLEETGLPPHRLLLEITENLLMKNTDEILATLNKLADLGISLALDDFGTGYSSLSYLTRFPVHKIKIDRSFVDQIETNEGNNTIINTIVGLGKSLDVTITAEGVETVGQAEYLRQLGCGEVQGYLFGRPRPQILAQRPRVAPVPTPQPLPQTDETPREQAEPPAPPKIVQPVA